MSQPITTPTAEEITQLPRWAQVAFAARCARLAQPVFLKNWPDAPKQHVEAIERAISFAEGSASSPVADRAATRATRATRAARAARTAAADTDAYAAAYAAADAAAYAAAAAYDNTDDAADAAYAASAADILLVPVIRQDFERLLGLSQQQQWNDETPVPPSVFGPLPSPSTVPSPLLIPPNPRRKVRLVVTATLPEGTDPDAISADLIELYHAINDAHIARGGAGLSLEDFQKEVLARVPEGVR